MTIKELEQRTGLPRTSIRFYEQEELLHPERKENNYRDYSEEDVRTLKKIKLLRFRQFSIFCCIPGSFCCFAGDAGI